MFWILLVGILLLTGCEEFTISEDEDTEYTYLEESPSCPSGTTAPYGDYQIDSQCQAACGYLEAGNTKGVEATCSILKEWEAHMDNRYASECGACGNTAASPTSPPADVGNTWLLCTKLEPGWRYYSCTANASCKTGYSLKASYNSGESCVHAGEIWLEGS